MEKPSLIDERRNIRWLQNLDGHPKQGKSNSVKWEGGEYRMMFLKPYSVATQKKIEINKYPYIHVNYIDNQKAFIKVIL